MPALLGGLDNSRSGDLESLQHLVSFCQSRGTLSLCWIKQGRLREGQRSQDLRYPAAGLG